MTCLLVLHAHEAGDALSTSHDLLGHHRRHALRGRSLRDAHLEPQSPESSRVTPKKWCCWQAGPVPAPVTGLPMPLRV